MLYSWTSSAPLFVEMHASPDEAPRFAEFWERSDASAGSSGSHVAPFTGIHGWYWQNRSTDNVTLTLEAAGPMSTSTVFDQFGEHPRELAPPEDAASES